jgi:ABC-type thiamine transport system substrate-binding protein
MSIRKTLVVLIVLALVVSTVPAGAQDEKITLRVMHWTPTMTMESDWWRSIVEGFEAEHPNVTIESNFVAFEQYLPTLEAMIAGDELPDVFFGLLTTKKRSVTSSSAGSPLALCASSPLTAMSMPFPGRPSCLVSSYTARSWKNSGWSHP